MPSSLIVVALVVAWLVVLVPMIVRKRQEIAKTADSALTGRVVRKGGAEEADVRDASLMDDETDDRDIDEDDDLDDGNDSTTERDEALDTTVESDDRDPVAMEAANDATPARRYRPGRGGFDPEAAALTARAKYAFRQRVVVAMLLLAIASAVVAAVMYPMAWWAHGATDLTLVTYLSYLRRQVRIEEEIRQRRMARIAQARRAATAAAPRKAQPRQEEAEYEDQYEEPEARPEPAQTVVSTVKTTPPPRITHPHAVVVDIDDEDPAFDELDDLDSLRYRRAAGE